MRIGKEALKTLYDAMLCDGDALLTKSGAGILRRIAETGWAHRHQIEDYVQLADRRMSDFGYALSPNEIAHAIGAVEQQFCYRPLKRSNSVSSYSGWTAFDAARMLILLEDIGFAVDPEPLVKAILPDVPKSGLMPMGALDALWYKRTRGKSKITLHREEGGAQPHEFKDHRLARGYKLTALLDTEGEPIELEVRGPKYRRPRPRHQVVCEQCGLEWTRGDPDSSAYHRQQHKERMAYLAPQPHAQIKAERESGTWNEEVTAASPRWRHVEMHNRALAFKREEGYSFVQWDLPERDPEVMGFLFTDDEDRIVGACAFRMRRHKERAPRWGLQFIWFAPSYRRCGMLTRRWRALRSQFGDFHIEGPVSEAMQAFAHKNGDERLMFGSDASYATYLADRESFSCIGSADATQTQHGR